MQNEILLGLRYLSCQTDLSSCSPCLSWCAGKGQLARLLHGWSARSAGPFQTIDCGALPENLIESELFGYEGGAFAGATREGRQGMIESANGGRLARACLRSPPPAGGPGRAGTAAAAARPPPVRLHPGDGAVPGREPVDDRPQAAAARGTLE
ncbi:MAG TPA: sigma 54-interacting transcriptional regulator [Symbiobacteriaceae bacterium]|nr:sigma 54-interacting transcriptional regulator [Symbiobacteriaceae bacterium]